MLVKMTFTINAELYKCFCGCMTFKASITLDYWNVQYGSPCPNKLCLQEFVYRIELLVIKVKKKTLVIYLTPKNMPNRPHNPFCLSIVHSFLLFTIYIHRSVMASLLIRHVTILF